MLTARWLTTEQWEALTFGPVGIGLEYLCLSMVDPRLLAMAREVDDG